MFRARTAAVTVLLCLIACAGARPSAAADKGIPRSARWIWYPEGAPARSAPGEKRYFRRRVELPAGAAVKSARLALTADNKCVLFINGERACVKSSSWQNIESLDVSKRLRPGASILAIEAANANPGPAGLLAWLDVRLKDGKCVLNSDGRRVADVQQRRGRLGARGLRRRRLARGDGPRAGVDGPVGRQPHPPRGRP
ncbi:MAG: hypothetical protein ACYTKD_18910 [Planctomycetota bacterium]|jgi:hypothetical protein